MNLQYQGTIDEPCHPIVLFFLCEGINVLPIELIIIFISCDSDMTLDTLGILLLIWSPFCSLRKILALLVD
jgi:hypothetical protein